MPTVTDQSNIDQQKASIYVAQSMLLGLIFLTIVFEWIRPISSSFWLDETGTVWVVRDGLSQAFHRSLLIQGQTPAYYLVAWLVRHAGGNSEALLRTISLLATAASAYFLYRIGRRWFDNEGSAIAVVIFVASANTSFAATDARPYALAVLFSLAALLCLIKWTESDVLRFGLLASLLTAVAIYVHYLFALIAPIECLYVWLRHRSGWRSSRRDLGVMVGLLLLLLIPTAPQLADLVRRRSALSFSVSPTIVDLLRVLGLPALLLLAGVILERIKPDQEGPRVARGNEVLTFGIAWTLLAPLALLVLAWTTSAELFVPRYFLTAVGGIALLGSWGIQKFHGRTLRVGVTTALVLASILANSSAAHTNEDWRGAAQAVRLDKNQSKPGLVLLWTGLTESRQPRLLKDPRRSGFLVAPASAYDFGNPAYALPFSLSARFDSYLDSLLQRASAATTIYVVSSRQNEPFVSWFTGRIPGLSPTYLGHFGHIDVFALRR